LPYTKKHVFAARKELDVNLIEINRTRGPRLPLQAVVGIMFLPLVFLGLGAIQLVTPAEAGEWKGQDTVRDGVRCLISPAEPMESPSTSKLNELWRIGGDTDDEDEFFGVISQIQTDDAGNLYLLDSQLNQVKIFDPDGGFIREIGREGEGPGEFRGPTSMFFTRDGKVAVLQLAPGKIVLLTP
jgi:hypothetical protein